MEDDEEVELLRIQIFGLRDGLENAEQIEAYENEKKLLEIENVEGSNSLMKVDDQLMILGGQQNQKNLYITKLREELIKAKEENRKLWSAIATDCLVDIYPSQSYSIFIFWLVKAVSEVCKVTIVVISRLVYRKGVDLLVKIIPPICKKHPNVRFIIGGDGPKRILLEEIREKFHLHDQVELRGFVDHDSVRDVLVQGNIFLNTSLTEAFCIAIVEAAAAGLRVVCTKVGGIPEVLPPEFIKLCEPDADDLMKTLDESIMDVKFGRVMDPFESHERVSRMYNWQDVAERTEVVYNSVVNNVEEPFSQKLKKYRSKEKGLIFGHIFCFLVIIDWLLLKIIETVFPAKHIDVAVNWRR
ncbi:hypothetical protein CHUAL_001172 [Chamberlinius hualienensis]